MSSKIQTYAELQKMIRKALREQHPEWIDANGKCTLCDSYEARFAKLVRIFAHRSAGAKIAGRGPVRAETLRRRSQFYSYQFSTVPGREPRPMSSTNVEPSGTRIRAFSRLRGRQNFVRRREHYNQLMDLLKPQAGAYGVGVEYAYTMVHHAPQSAVKPQSVPKKAAH